MNTASSTGPSALSPDPHPGEVCITCSDMAVAVTVTALLGDGLALVDTGAGPGTEEEVSVALVDAGVGHTVLVHAGEAIARVEPPGPIQHRSRSS
ncbi:HypC/HybG/HupF family hydrogenase formation chaperone [Pseudonocardia sp.]|jgi:hydrogenase expression/formation protein HypC|uniref:HypC/HybG/HupF family hydrogenase formation chaperone n=1 Tax=Pseudonocardia sp. TaxID=60912 RepID=UPI002DB03C2F|nr:HypC/HybG/HupF family hydrogenase formation chaperone [Pseudonocardia sp.]